MERHGRVVEGGTGIGSLSEVGANSITQRPLCGNGLGGWLRYRVGTRIEQRMVPARETPTHDSLLGESRRDVVYAHATRYCFAYAEAA